MDSLTASVEQPAASELQRPFAIRTPMLLLGAVCALVTTVLILYSQTRAFVWDEGFHLLAAQLIASGKTPYLDFCFPQTPLNAYLNAGIIQVFGADWRVIHLFATMFAAAAVFLAAEWILSRFPISRWRIACALTVAVMIGLNNVVVEFGTVGQAYGVCLFFTVVAFRAALAAAARPRSLLALWAGLFAGITAASSLLTAPVAPVLLLWICRYNRSGRIASKAAAFCAGTLLPFLPVFWLFLQSPRTVFFNVVQYQALYRRVNWDGANTHDIDVLSAWLDSTQALFMGLLAIAGAAFVWRTRRFNPPKRSEFCLAVWLTLALGIYAAIAHPTFGRYFIFVVPFLSILASVGLYWVASRLAGPEHPFWAAAVVIVLLTLSFARELFTTRDDMQWKDCVQIAKRVQEVTPPGGNIYADELVYFLLQRTPPPGLEFSYANKLELPLAEQRLFHIKSYADLKQEIHAGVYATVETCKDELVDYFKLPALFPNQADVSDCSLFWGRTRVQHPAAPQASK